MAFLAIPATISIAQTNPGRWYLDGYSSAVLYQGDREWTGESGLGGLAARTGPGVEFGFGYRVWESTDLAFSVLTGIYPGIRSNGEGLPRVDPHRSSEYRYTYSLESRFRLLPFGKVEPALIAGWGFVTGIINDSRDWGSGPVFGLSVHRPAGPVSIGLILREQLVIPDKAVDLGGSGANPDLLPSLGLGIRWHARARTPRLQGVSLSAPGFLDSGEEGVFTVSTDLEPASYQVEWDFGDGTIGTGFATRHAWKEAGSYPVLARVSTVKETVELKTTVSVTERIEPASIVSLIVSPLSPMAGDSLDFQPLVRGTDVQCHWAFGDGQTSDSCDTTHSYGNPGVYAATLNISNQTTTDAVTRTIRVREDACRAIDRLATVYFRRHSDELVLEMREVLRENFSMAARCPDRVLIITGHAFDTERNSEELAVGRARAVLQYYLNLGLASDHIELGPAIVQQEDGWGALIWQGRRTMTTLERR